MKKIHILLSVIIAIGIVLGAVYRFDCCKADKQEFKQYVAFTDIRFLQEHRKYIQQRIWAIQKQKPTTYQHDMEYLRLVNELMQIDLKINAYYKRKG